MPSVPEVSGVGNDIKLLFENYNNDSTQVRSFLGDKS